MAQQTNAPEWLRPRKLTKERKDDERFKKFKIITASVRNDYNIAYRGLEKEHPDFNDAVSAIYLRFNEAMPLHALNLVDPETRGLVEGAVQARVRHITISKPGDIANEKTKDNAILSIGDTVIVKDALHVAQFIGRVTKKGVHIDEAVEVQPCASLNSNGAVNPATVVVVSVNDIVRLNISIESLSTTLNAYVAGCEKVKQCTGLRNIGNTCYMNAALQCLANTRALSNFCRINKQNRGTLVFEFVNIVNSMLSGDYKALSPHGLKDLIDRRCPEFNNNQHHDSHEWLLRCIDGLATDLNESAGIVPLESSDDRPEELVAKDAWDNHIRCNRSIIVDIFDGLWRSCVTCNDCNYQSVKYEIFTGVPLTVPFQQLKLLNITEEAYATQPNHLDSLVPHLKVSVSQQNGQWKMNPDYTAKLFVSPIGSVESIPEVTRLDGMTPVRIAIVAPPDSTLKALKQQISDVVSSSLEPGGMLLIEIGCSPLNVSVLSDNGNVCSLRSKFDLYAYEVPTPSNPYIVDGTLYFTGFCLAVHRKLDKPGWNLFQLWQGNMVEFSMPFVVPVDSSSPTWTGAQMYNAVWSQVKHLASTTSAAYPFVLRTVDRGRRYCSKCSAYKYCIGCKIESFDTTLCTMDSDSFIAVDWDVTALRKDNQHYLDMVVRLKKGNPTARHYALMRVEFSNPDIRKALLRNSMHLIKSALYKSVYVRPDQTPAELARHKLLVAELKQRQSAGENVIICSRSRKVVLRYTASA